MTSSEPQSPLPIRLDLDDHAGPAARLPRGKAAAMVEAALVDFGAGVAPRARTLLWKQLAVAAAGLLMLVSAAAAARFYFHFGQSTQETRAARGRNPKASAAKSPLPDPVRQATPVPQAAPAQQPNPATTPRASISSTRKPARGPSLDRGASAPDDLLQRANHLRAAGQFQEAAHTYAQVYERFPRSSSAYVARVAGGSIELEHLANPTRARRLFEQAMRARPAGALDLEVRQGLCVALRDLEDRPGEIRALRGLVQAHPDSPAARRARVRLRAIASNSQ